MRVLSFSVDGQKLTKDPGCDFSNIVKGSVGYLQVAFVFTDDWSACGKMAIFNDKYAAVIDKFNKADIPPEALTGDSFTVRVRGISKGTKFDTNRLTISQVR